MKHNPLRIFVRTALLSLFGLSVLFLFLLWGTGGKNAAKATYPAAQAAPVIVPWTAVASTGAIDEAAFGIYSFNSTWLEYRPGSISTEPIVARYNVTNTNDNNTDPNAPGWSSLELGSFAPAGSTVVASFYRVNPCDGQRVLVCQTVNQGSTYPVCTRCYFTPTQVNFANYLYYVELTVDRATAGAFPRAFTLRLR